MKTIKSILTIVALLGFTFSGQAQDKNPEEIKIKTSSVCNMCKKTIEKSMAYEKGVKSAILDVDSQVLTVAFFPSKTNPDKLRKAVTLTGYDADQVPANERAYNKLEDCCKKDKGIHKN
ncbi:heavy-metal-associated domain-containing protein [Adhaeribacter swui]|uniref:Heavy-metal-associated domain-containing protein n=1 Tax=Adhaeribacter swui TaxID=2086471 RepID=A0A7G7GAU5_9BACT|nr:heavy metal-associated domain-containing protein [Adhaeribacter swui]QNF34279.1 heavy-metal-associated domain-containing protein [Adhaeribacter swui]